MRRPHVVTTLALVASTLVAGPAQAGDTVDTEPLRDAVTVRGVMQHERAFQKIADENGGTRFTGTAGYTESVAYVERKLEKAGYRVRVQPFDFVGFTELAPSQVTLPGGQAFASTTMQYSGSGTVEGRVVLAGGAGSQGCEAGDFAAASASSPEIALVARGTCDFAVKVGHAVTAGYDAVIIFGDAATDGETGLEGSLLAPVEVPVVGTSNAVGAELRATSLEGGLSLRVATSTKSEQVASANVLATSKTGNKKQQVVVGAHLDSVRSAGINDNGSGSATILEIAEQMAELEIKPRNQVRFAFWGAEEYGLIGSTYYVNQLSAGQRERTAANLNYDMVGSINYVRFVYDGDGSTGGPVGPEGSAQIEAIFNDYFESQDLASDPTPFNGRSDYGPFIRVGIPAGGLFTGAEGRKTEEQAEVYGGTAGLAYDPCYHQVCDDIDNLSRKALDEMSDAAAHTFLVLAKAKKIPGSTGTDAGVPAETFDYRGGQLVR